MFPERLFASLQRNFEHQVSGGGLASAIFELVVGEEGEASMGFKQNKKTEQGFRGVEALVPDSLHPSVLQGLESLCSPLFLKSQILLEPAPFSMSTA